MTDDDPDATYPWLPSGTLLGWVGIDPDNQEKADQAEIAREAAAEWVQGKRRDLFVTTGEGEEEVSTFTPGPDVFMAGLLAAQRLIGVGAAFQELGAGSFLKDDAEIHTYLGINKNVPLG